MIDIFASPAPRPNLADKLTLFAPLIGHWDLEVRNVESDGTVRVVDGEWWFTWALDGRAVADVWMSPSRRNRTDQCEGEFGTSIRFFDPILDAWRSTWHGPARGWVIPFVGRPCEEGIELTGRRDDVELRWVFSDIGPDSFEWRAEETPFGAPMTVRQRFSARRAND
ncbi:hypothetical protein MMUR_06970 [Mycolicibacterium murale]|uniref:DUF1579 domain-containing protein n=1 Tax=Mycolicibacterium murale TaxID=182220 RepID=A0A7I9WFN2_9MYCO|nr:hypothetical protein [Mycolicibacterium murale]MCV7183006.1 hypothetical protein [Mycolicibacterium murale]GFG56561.1 hypothetical protein MMUR_06970 [Mycolicibacterium murale]